MPWTYVGWPTWDAIEKVANSPFGAALVAGGLASLAGALGGAYAAQSIADRAVRRKALWDEIKNCNAGIDAAGSICSGFLNLKGHHIVEMKRLFDEQRDAVHAHFLDVRTGRIPKGQPFPVGAVDQQALPHMRIPVARLETIMMEKLAVAGRARGLATLALRSIDLANDSIRLRNETIEKCKPLSKNERNTRIFGLPLPDGSVDNTYCSCMEAIWKYANDVIYFTSQLCLELNKHGQRMEQTFKQRFRGRAPRTSRVYFNRPQTLPLMPDPADYASWEETYIQLVSPTEGRRWSKAWYWLRLHLRGSPVGRAVRWLKRRIWPLKKIGATSQRE